MNAHEKRWLLLGIGLIVLALIIGLTTGCTIKQLPSEEPVALPTAPERETTTTRATTTTTTQPEPDLNFGWLDTYCWSDCSVAYPDEAWSYLEYADPDEFVEMMHYFQGFTYAEMDELCDLFWETDDQDIWDLAFDNDIDPDAWVAALYYICDS